jgi:carboxypeptidase family protein
MKVLWLRSITLRWPVGSALLLLALAGPAFAAATVSGTVKVPDSYSQDQITVTASDANNHLFRVVADDSDGTYTLDGIAPGTYTLTVQAKGSETPPIQNVVLTDGQTLKQDFTLAPAKPVCFVKAAAPIPLEDDINSASFADAPDIHVDSIANLIEPVLDLPVLNQWGGPATAGGRFRMKYSSAGIHLAADITYKVSGVNFGAPNKQYLGNAIEFDFQNDPYDPEREKFDADHDWQFVVGLGETPQWVLHRAHSVDQPMLDGQPEPVGKHILIKDRPNKDGQLVRIDIPWEIYLESDGTTLITPPKDGDLAAVEISIDYNNPDSTQGDTKDPLYQLTWSGLDTGFGEGNSLKPIQFCAQAP